MLFQLRYEWYLILHINCSSVHHKIVRFGVQRQKMGRNVLGRFNVVTVSDPVNGDKSLQTLSEMLVLPLIAEFLNYYRTIFQFVRDLNTVCSTFPQSKVNCAICTLECKHRKQYIARRKCITEEK